METPVLCTTCGRPTIHIFAKKCTICYNVESMIDRYLKSEKGLSLIRKKLADLRYEWVEDL